MSAMERVTGSDWRIWFRCLLDASTRGAALGVKASGLVSMSAVATTDKWQPTTIDLNTLLYTALIGFITGLVDFFIEEGFPDGTETAETTVAVTKIDKTTSS